MSPRTRTDVRRTRATASSWFSRLIALVVTGLVVGLLPPTAALAATPTESPEIADLAVTIDDATLLAGAQTTVTLKAKNPGSAGHGDLFNATGVAILPPGVSYVPGSSPFGDPVQKPWIPDPAQPSVTGTVLVWENVALRTSGGVRVAGR